MNKDLLTEYHHDLSSYMDSRGLQPLLFPDQETEVTVPPIQANIKHCHKDLSAAHAALLLCWIPLLVS